MDESDFARTPVVVYGVKLLAFVTPWLGLVPFVVVALIWLVPDRRMEHYVTTHGTAD